MACKAANNGRLSISAERADDTHTHTGEVNVVFPNFDRGRRRRRERTHEST
jgi:hypothetical protein